VAETPIRAPGVEELLAGRELDSQTISDAEEAAKQGVAPITDVRGTAEYRKAMCGVLLRRALNTAVGRLS